MGQKHSRCCGSVFKDVGGAESWCWGTAGELRVTVAVLVSVVPLLPIVMVRLG